MGKYSSYVCGIYKARYDSYLLLLVKRKFESFEISYE